MPEIASYACFCISARGPVTTDRAGGRLAADTLLDLQYDLVKVIGCIRLACRGHRHYANGPTHPESLGKAGYSAPLAPQTQYVGILAAADGYLVRLPLPHFALQLR